MDNKNKLLTKLTIFCSGFCPGDSDTNDVVQLATILLLPQPQPAPPLQPQPQPAPQPAAEHHRPPHQTISSIIKCEGRTEADRTEKLQKQNICSMHFSSSNWTTLRQISYVARV